MIRRPMTAGRLNRRKVLHRANLAANARKGEK